ncbi:hypothetical protein HJFPF1_01282 [Paramyrothecium foliicola]|nr:hypothetical protein HJFPF1_01282 [Paramyrothecium foliicola]
MKTSNRTVSQAWSGSKWNHLEEFLAYNGIQLPPRVTTQVKERGFQWTPGMRSYNTGFNQDARALATEYTRRERLIMAQPYTQTTAANPSPKTISIASTTPEPPPAMIVLGDHNR